VDCSVFVDVLEVVQGKVDRSMGDVHPNGNPHYMWDPRRAAKVASGVAKRLAGLDPAHASAFEANTKELVGVLERWREHWERKLAPLRGQKLIAYHRSFVYLADWLGFEVAINIEPRPGIPPNPAHVAHVIAIARDGGAKIILQEAWFPTTTSSLVAKQSGAKLVVVPGSVSFRKGQSYTGFIDDVVNKLAEAVR
jgi:zinc/manganese transport system substrate-binding protein